MGEARERYGGLRCPRRMVGLPRHWVYLPSLLALAPASPPSAERTLDERGFSSPSPLPLLFTPGAHGKPVSSHAHPSSPPYPPSSRKALTNGAAVKMHSVTLLILSSGHFTGFLGQIFSPRPSKLFLKSKWQPWGKKAKQNLRLTNRLRNACPSWVRVKDYSPHRQAEIFSIQSGLLWCR